jgi:alkaline phosphatase D
VTGGSPAAPFTHAVASFDPTPTGVLLWTRAPGAGALEWVVARDGALREVAASGSVVVRPDADHTAVVDVDGLSPGETWFYAFSAADGARSPVGRTRTLPAPGADGPVRLGLTCCALFSEAPFAVYRALAEREVDVVLHLGDAVYETAWTTGARRHDPPHDAVTLDDYRRRHACNRADPDAVALHLRHPVLAVWDDHDVSDNASRHGSHGHDPATEGPWADRVAAALRARSEWMPSRIDGPPFPPAVSWRTVDLGGVAELALLDTRFAGRDRQVGDGGAADRDDPDRSLLGPVQRAWLHERVDRSTKPWLVIVTSVVLNEIALPVPGVRFVDALLPSGYAYDDGRVLNDDQWDGYTAERAALVAHLADCRRSGRASLVLSGDVHSSWAFEGPRSAGPGASGEAVTVELTTPAVASPPMAAMLAPGFGPVVARGVRALPHVRWADISRRGHAVLHLTPDRAVAEWWHLDPFARDPSAERHRAAAFAVARAADPPVLVPVAARDLPPDPVRPVLPAPLPARPADLERMRRWRRRRRARTAVRRIGRVGGALAALVGAWAAAVSAKRRRS